MRRESAPRFADVSVIVAAYRAADTIGRALASIAHQTVKPREVIVVDDGSDDGTADTARAHAPVMKGVELRVFGTEDNRGAGAARNRAVAEARQPVVAFLDADDEWLPEKIERSLAVFDEGNYVLVAHDYLTGFGAAELHHHCARRFEESADPFVGLYRKGYIASCSVITRRDAVLDAGGFDEGLRNAQDFDLWLAMLRKPGTPFKVFGEALMRYHPTPGGIMSHTARRVRCGMVIAARYLPDLRGRPGSPYESLWYRIVALHLEAIRAYGTKGEIGSVLTAGLLLPLNLILMTVRCLAGDIPLRSTTAKVSPSVSSAPATAFLWLWVVAALGAYLWQFREFVPPILQMVGIT